MNLRAATFNLTDACNLACSYCFRHGEDPHERFISEDMLMSQLNFFFNNFQGPFADISWWGGEPLLAWDLLKKGTRYAKAYFQSRNIKTVFGGTTNGTLLTPNKFDFLEQNETSFMVTIDGKKDIHDACRRFKSGSGSYGLIMENMKHILKKWPWYMIRMSTTREGILHLRESFEEMYKAGVKQFYHSPVYEDPATYEEYFDAYMETGLWFLEKRQTDPGISWKHLDEGCKSLLYGFSDTRPCGAGRFYFGFSIDGSVYPCHRFIKSDRPPKWEDDPFVIGHIDHGFFDNDLAKQFVNFENLLTTCKTCEIYDKFPCKGGCYATNQDLMGNIYTPSPHICDNTRAQMNACKRLIEIAKEKGWKLLRQGDEQSSGKSCICNNACYSEGTPEETINVDPTVDSSCTCFNTMYSGPMKTDIARSLTQEEREEKDPVLSRISKIEKELKITTESLATLARSVSNLAQAVLTYTETQGGK